MSLYGCATVCELALEPVCRCRCGGQNHGKVQHAEFAGYFCEGCDKPFGTGRAVWGICACYVQSGTSTKYLTRFGNPAIASWCRDCYARKHEWGIPSLDRHHEQGGGWVRVS